jgi:hypothetical protein
VAKPLADLVPEEPLDRILLGSQLVCEAVGAEEWNTGRPAVYSPALPGDPDVEVQQPRRMGQRCNNVALNGNRMPDKFPIECVAENYDIAGNLLSRRLHVVLAIEPELHLVKEVEASPINNEMLPELVF